MCAQRITPALNQVQEEFSEYFDSIELLKGGGQALLYKGRRNKTSKGVSTDQTVAIKIYLDPNENARVDKEIQAAREAICNSLVKFISSGSVRIDNEVYRFVIWEYVNGIDLEQYIQSKPCSPSLVAVVGRDVSAAIEALWIKRVVHRDINPKNIMVRKGEEGAVLIDLGIAKHIDQTALTAPGLTWGTQGYFSPEQLAGANLTCQSDVFSLGVTLQQALFGSHPTNGDQAQLLYGPKPTHQLCPSSPAGLAMLIDRMLHIRPARRPQLSELITEFTRLAETL